MPGRPGHPSNKNRQTKAHALAKPLSQFPGIHDPDMAKLPQSARRQVAAAAGVKVTNVSDHTWKLALGHARNTKEGRAKMPGEKPQNLNTAGARKRVRGSGGGTRRDGKGRFA